MTSFNRNSTNALFFLCIAALSLIMATGCSSKKPVYSGFLGDYSKLTEDKDHKGDMFWKDPNVSLKKYQKFQIDPIVFHLTPELQERAENVDPGQQEKVATYFENAIKKALSPEYEVVTEPGPDVARLRIALTGVTVERKDLKAYQYIPVALVLTGVSEAAGKRDKVALARMEGEALDSVTGKRIGAVVQQDGSEVSAQTLEELEEKDIYPTLDYWAEKLKNRLLTAE